MLQTTKEDKEQSSHFELIKYTLLPNRFSVIWMNIYNFILPDVLSV